MTKRAAQMDGEGPKGAVTMELVVRDVRSLFNSLDAAPFREKDLDPDAVEFIVTYAQEHSLSTPLSLRIGMHEWPDQDPTPMIRDAVHNYFQYRSRMMTLEFRQLMKQARTSLIIGLAFLALCVVLLNYVLPYIQGTWVKVVSESLVIAGWVVMWRPLELYLYDWWPLLAKRRVYDKLGKIPVQVLPAAKD